MNSEIIRFSSVNYFSDAAEIVFKGCPLRCGWCPRPETRSPAREIMFDIDSCKKCGLCSKACGVGMQKMKPSRIYDRSFCTVCGNCIPACPYGYLSDARFESEIGKLLTDAVRQGKGKLILSGGEPAMQEESFLALIKAAKQAGFKVEVHTCGVFNGAIAGEICKFSDAVVFTVFDTDPERFKKNTRGDLETVLINLRLLDRYCARLFVKCLILPGVNDERSHAEKLAGIYRSLVYAEGIELFTYTAEQLAESARRAKLVDVYYGRKFKSDPVAFSEFEKYFKSLL